MGLNDNKKVSHLHKYYLYHQQIFDSLGITQDQSLNHPLLVNTGNSFVVLGVKNKQILADLKLDYEAIKSISEELDLIGYYIYVQLIF